MLPPDAFYLDDPPPQLQQGDICAGVPVLMLPPSEEFVLIRSTDHNDPIEELTPGYVNLVREQAAPHPFEEGHEYVAVSATMNYAMLMTPTCDLAHRNIFAVWPLYPITAVEESERRASNIYQLPHHRHFGNAFIDFGDFRAVGREHFLLKDRVASVTREALQDTIERYNQSVARVWGFGPGETVEHLAKYETGKFRCIRCAIFDLQDNVITLSPGTKFPECPNCQKIHKKAQWVPLTKHRKF